MLSTNPTFVIGPHHIPNPVFVRCVLCLDQLLESSALSKWLDIVSIHAYWQSRSSTSSGILETHEDFSIAIFELIRFLSFGHRIGLAFMIPFGALFVIFLPYNIANHLRQAFGALLSAALLCHLWPRIPPNPALRLNSRARFISIAHSLRNQNLNHGIFATLSSRTSTSPHDMVFGILGVLQRNGMGDHFKNLSYDNPCANLYFQLAKTLVEATNFPEILVLAAQHRCADNVPSWIPDFHKHLRNYRKWHPGVREVKGSYRERKTRSHPWTRRVLTRLDYPVPKPIPISEFTITPDGTFIGKFEYLGQLTEIFPIISMQQLRHPDLTYARCKNLEWLKMFLPRGIRLFGLQYFSPVKHQLPQVREVFPFYDYSSMRVRWYLDQIFRSDIGRLRRLGLLGVHDDFCNALAAHKTVILKSEKVYGMSWGNSQRDIRVGDLVVRFRGEYESYQILVRGEEPALVANVNGPFLLSKRSNIQVRIM